MNNQITYKELPQGFEAIIIPRRNKVIIFAGAISLLLIVRWIVDLTTQVVLRKPVSYGLVLAQAIDGIYFILPLYFMIWQLLGREIVEINSDVLVVKKALFGIPFSKKIYKIKDISQVRSSAENYASQFFNFSKVLPQPSILFEYNDTLNNEIFVNTKGFASGLEDAAAKELLVRLGDRLSVLAPIAVKAAIK